MTDTDFAGSKASRKSTSGGLVQLGTHAVKSWSSTEAVVALSSGEAEYYGIVRGASEGFGSRSVLKDLNVEARLRLKEDSSAAVD